MCTVSARLTAADRAHSVGTMLDKLEFLLSLARERHFRKAAEAAGLTQPTLSSALKSLADQFGWHAFGEGPGQE